MNRFRGSNLRGQVVHRARVAVTGVGLVTPLGASSAESWQGVLNGRRAVRWLDDADVCDPLSSGPGGGRWFGAPAAGQWPPGSRLSPMAVTAAAEAIAHAGLDRNDLRAAGCVIGASKLDLKPLDLARLDRQRPGTDFIAFEDLFPSAPAAAVAGKFRLRGAALCPVAACATGLVSIVRAAELIREGLCSTVLAGSVDASVHPAFLACYKRLRVLARPGERPNGPAVHLIPPAPDSPSGKGPASWSLKIGARRLAAGRRRWRNGSAEESAAIPAG